MTQCQAEKTGSVEKTNAWARQEHESDKGGQYGLPQRVEAESNGALRVKSPLFHAWQNDVKASVDNTWQISPLRHMLLVGVFVLDRTKFKT